VTSAEPASILCVDDNTAVAEALRIKLRRAGGFDWKGWLPTAESLAEAIGRDPPELVLLDVDMPGPDPFAVLAEVSERFPQTRVVMFTGFARRDLVVRALDSGAWGYVCKNDGEDELLSALQKVRAGELALSPEAARLISD
jgi:DNA-binding NarL/FixJ family response regulator